MVPKPSNMYVCVFFLSCQLYMLIKDTLNFNEGKQNKNGTGILLKNM